MVDHSAAQMQADADTLEDESDFVSIVLGADALLYPQFQCSSPFASDSEFWLATELRFSIIALHTAAHQNLCCSAVGRKWTGPSTGANGNRCAPVEAAQRVQQLKTARQEFCERMSSRLAQSVRTPLVLQLARAYGLSDAELDAFLLLVLIQGGHRSNLFAAACLDDEVDDGLGDARLLRRVCGLAPVA